MTSSGAGAPGRRLGRYHLVEPLGGGPTGEVYRAKVYGVAGFERPLAVKRFHPAMVEDPEVASRLAGAARLYGSLEHPRVARLHEFGVAGDETFTATELVEGADVAQLIDGGGLPQGAAAAISVQACRAIGYAHGRGLSHLGVCPTNLIVAPTGAVKVTDFGVLPPRLPARPAADPTLAGRLPYLAPEQLAGESTSPATDVFQLGLVAYELLLGEKPFPGRDAVAIAAAIEAARAVDPALPKPLAKVLQRALARSPFERFPDAGAMADAIEAAVRSAPIPGSVSHAAAAVQRIRAEKLALQTGQTSGAMTFPLPSPPPGEADPRRPLAGLPPPRPAAPAAKKTLMLGQTPMRIPDRPEPASERAPTTREDTGSFGGDTFSLDLDTEARTTPRGGQPEPGAAEPGRGAASAPVGDVLELIEDELDGGAESALDLADPDQLGVRETLDGLGPPAPPSLPGPFPPPSPPGRFPPPVPGTGPAASPGPSEPSGARPLAPDPFGAPPASGAATRELSGLETLTEIVPAPPAKAPPPAIVAESLRAPRRPAPRRGLARGVLYVALFAVLAAGSFVGYGILTDSESSAARAPAADAAPRLAAADTDEAGADPAGEREAASQDSADEGPDASAEEAIDDSTAEAAAAAAADEAAAAAADEAAAAAADEAAAAVTPPEPPAGDPEAGAELTVTTTPPGAKLYLDGALIGATPQTLDASADRHTLALILPGHELVTREVEGGGTLAIELPEVTPSGGRGGIKVRCRAKNRYYVFVDGDPTGQLCPTERIGVKLGRHVVEVYDPVTDSRRVFKVPVKQSRRSVRVRID